jgi:hypothetical protein
VADYLRGSASRSHEQQRGRPPKRTIAKAIGIDPALAIRNLVGIDKDLIGFP